MVSSEPKFISLSLTLRPISMRILSTFYWSHNPCYVVWLCVWHARLLLKCHGLSLGISFGLCCSSSSLQQKAECVVKSKPEMAGIRIRSCKLHYSIHFELTHSNSETILTEGERLAVNYPYSYLTLSSMGLFQFFICGKSSILSFFSNQAL